METPWLGLEILAVTFFSWGLCFRDSPRARDLGSVRRAKKTLSVGGHVSFRWVCVVRSFFDASWYSGGHFGRNFGSICGF